MFGKATTNEKLNGVHANFSNGLTLANKKLFTGVGLGYLNFEGIKGISAFGDFEYLPLKNQLTPLLNILYHILLDLDSENRRLTKTKFL